MARDDGQDGVAVLIGDGGVGRKVYGGVGHLDADVGDWRGIGGVDGEDVHEMGAFEVE